MSLPAFATPNVLALRPLQAALDNIREALRQVDSRLSSVTTQAGQNTQLVGQGSTAAADQRRQLTQLRIDLDAQTARLDALASVSVVVGPGGVAIFGLDGEDGDDATGSVPTGMFLPLAGGTMTGKLIVQGDSAASANIQEWRNVAGTVFGYFGPDRKFVVKDDTSPAADRYVIAGEANYGRQFGLYIQPGGNEGGFKADSQFYMKAGAGGIQMQGGPSQVAVINISQVTINGTAVHPHLVSATEGMLFGFNASHYQIFRGFVRAETAALVGLRVRAYIAQSADLQQWQDSAGAILSAINYLGNLGLGTPAPTAILHIKAGTAAANTAPQKFTSGALNTVPEAGAHEFNGNHYLTNAALRFAVGGNLFSYYADANNGTTLETDLYSSTLAVNTFNQDGDTVVARYGGVFAGDATSTQRLRAYFGGTLILDSGATGFGVGTFHWSLSIVLIRASSTIVRASATLNTSFASLSAYATSTKVTGLILSNTQILKITGTAAGATGGSNQVTAFQGDVDFDPAA